MNLHDSIGPQVDAATRRRAREDVAQLMHLASVAEAAGEQELPLRLMALAQDIDDECDAKARRAMPKASEAWLSPTRPRFAPAAQSLPAAPASAPIARVAAVAARAVAAAPKPVHRGRAPKTRDEYVMVQRDGATVLVKVQVPV